MTSKLDPQELGRLREVADRPQATLGDEFLFLCALGKWFRTGQLVPAMPSGDVVEAVAVAFQQAAPGLDPAKYPDTWAIVERVCTAAITTYEAVSGVAKMRDALKKTMTALSEAIEEERARINSMRGAVLERTTNRDLAAVAEWQSAVDAARAALGEKP